MNTLWRKAIRDLSGERLRSTSIIFALALGIAGFFAVLSAYAILIRALNDGYLATNPPAAILAIDHLDDEIVRAVLDLPEVESAEARRTVRGRMRAGPAQWKNLTLFARRSFEASRIGMVSLESGAWPVGNGEMAIERDALQVASAKVGDVVTVRTETGSEHSLRVTGSIHDVGQAQARMENLVYGYVTLETLAALGIEPFYNELAIRVAKRRLDEAHIHDVANSIAETILKSGHRLLRIEVPEPGQHPHAKLMGLLMLSMAVFGFFILALSGLMVFNALTALLAGQVRQIGVMKAIGGSRVQIGRVYLLEAGLLGAAAIIVALPIGLVGGRWLCQWMAVFLNFDIESYAVPMWIYALVFAVGIAVPVVAASIPVWLGTRVSVREALAPNGPLGRLYGTRIVDRALARVSGPSRVLLLALRNASRNRLRVALTLVTLAAGGVFFMSALNLRQSMVHTVDRFYERSRADLTVSLASDYPCDAVERAARRLPGVSAAEGWIVVSGVVPSTAGDRRRNELTVNGLPLDSRVINFDLSDGVGLGGDARGAVVNTALYNRLDRPEMGAEVRLRVDGANTSMRLLGVAYEPFTFPAAYVPRAFFDDRSQAQTANSLRVALASPNPASLEASKANVEAGLEREGIRALQATTKTETRYSIDAHLIMIYVFLIAVSCILGGVGIAGLMTTVSLGVTERRREMGVLRAIGATPVRVAQIVVIEGVVVGVMAWLLAIAAVVPLGKAIAVLMLRLLLRSDTELSIAIEPMGVVIWLVVALAGSALACLWPAWQASRASVREALTYE